MTVDLGPGIPPTPEHHIHALRDHGTTTAVLINGTWHTSRKPIHDIRIAIIQARARTKT